MEERIILDCVAETTHPNVIAGKRNMVKLALGSSKNDT